jgi:hypothetical protein
MEDCTMQDRNMQDRTQVLLAYVCVIDTLVLVLVLLSWSQPFSLRKRQHTTSTTTTWPSACPANSTSLPSSANITACLCHAGFGGPPGGPCALCVAGTYELGRGCLPCAANADTAPGALDHAACLCRPGALDPAACLFLPARWRRLLSRGLRRRVAS